MPSDSPGLPTPKGRPNTYGRPQRWQQLCAICAFGLAPVMGVAHELSVEECVEGGDFISNAALSREAGMSKSKFMGQIEEDLVAIQAFPPQLRWFVQDSDDAAFLLESAADVFDSPKEAATHRQQFLVACLGRSMNQRTLQQVPITLPKLDWWT